MIYLAAEIAQDVLGLKINCKDVEAMLIEYHEKTLIEYPSWVVNHEKLMSYVLANRASFVNSSYITNAQGYEEKDKILFMEVSFKDICKKLDIDRTTFLEELKAHGVLDCLPDRYYKRKVVNGTSSKFYCVYKDLNTLKTSKSGSPPLSTSSGKKPAQPAVNELNLIEKEELMSYEFYS